MAVLLRRKSSFNLRAAQSFCERMKQPLVTVVIPAFNAERFLERTLQSALQQTYQELEVIVVNDGSTDATEGIAKGYAQRDPRLRVVSVPNGGVASARNVGLYAGQGEFVAFLDSDDLWHPTKVQHQVSSLIKSEGSGAAASYTLMRIIDVDDRIIRNGSGVGYSGYIFSRHLFSRPVGNGSSLLVRRETALLMSGFDPTWAARGIGGCEDLDFELKIAARYPIQATRLFLVGYRAYPGNMSSDGLTLARSVLSTVESHLQAHPELPDWAVRKMRASTLEYALHNIAGVKQWKLFASELTRLIRLDFGRGVNYAAQFAIRRALGQVREHKGRFVEAEERPFFYDIDSSMRLDPAGRIPRARDRKLVEQLAALDAAYAKEHMGGL